MVGWMFRKPGGRWTVGLLSFLLFTAFAVPLVVCSNSSQTTLDLVPSSRYAKDNAARS